MLRFVLMMLVEMMLVEGYELAQAIASPK